MLLKDANELITLARDAITETLNAVREDGVCRLCQAKQGVQHSATCPVWSLTQWRGEFWRRNEPELKLEP